MHVNSLRAMKKLDALTYKDLFKRHYPVLMGFACRFVSRQVAEDLVQDVFITVWENRENLVINNMFSFLLKSVQNRCLDYLKHQLVVKEYEAYVRIAKIRMEYLMERSDDNQLYSNLNRADLSKELKKAISRLSPKCAQACELYYFHGYSTKEIAIIMNQSPRTIEGYFYQAIQFLREELQGLDLLYVIYLLQIINLLK